QGFLFLYPLLYLIAGFVQFVVGFHKVLPENRTKQVHGKDGTEESEPIPGCFGDGIFGNVEIPRIVEKKYGEHGQVDDEVQLAKNLCGHITAKYHYGQNKNERTLNAATMYCYYYRTYHGQNVGKVVG